MTQNIFIFCAVLLMFLAAGCNSYKGDFVIKTEKQLAEMEISNQQAHQEFLKNNYAGSEKILKELTKERTVSRPLYQLELLSVLLLQGKHDEAHKIIMSLHQDLETLTDTRLEEKAQSVWHGEVNKVYKGDSYERSTFYALMALSFIRIGNYEDALRSVKNGLLAEADANNKKSTEDYALLHYLGYFAASRMNNPNEAKEYLRALYKGLEPRGFFAEDANGNKISDHCFKQLEQSNHNVILVIWAGQPPEVMCTGEYKEKRTIIRGKNPFDMMKIAIAQAPSAVIPNNLADINYQATTRGGRLMDNVLADKATAKKIMNTSGNVFIIAGTGLVIAGARCMSSPPVGISLLGAGAGCWLIGGGFYLAGYIMNPAADPRFWRNIPCQLYVVPLNLAPGKHQIMVTGYSNFDATKAALFNINIPASGFTNVIHLPMMKHTDIIQGLRHNNNLQEYSEIIEKANSDRFMREIK